MAAPCGVRIAWRLGGAAIRCSARLGVIGQFLQPEKHMNYLLCSIYCLLALTSGHASQLSYDGSNLTALWGIHAGRHVGGNSVEDRNRSVKCGEPIARTLATIHLCPQMNNDLTESAAPFGSGCVLSLPVSGCGFLLSSLISLSLPSFGEKMNNKPTRDIHNQSANYSDGRPIRFELFGWYHWLVLVRLFFFNGPSMCAL